VHFGDRLGRLGGDRRIEAGGERGAPGIRRLLEVTAARFGVAEQHVTLARLVAVRIQLRQPLAQLRYQCRLLHLPLPRHGDPVGERHGGQPRRPAREVQGERADRYHQKRQQHGDARTDARPCFGAPGRRQQPPLHLEHCTGMFRGGDASVGQVAVQFGELRAVQRHSRLLPPTRGGSAAQRKGERCQGDRRQQGDGEPDHDFSRSARRCRSASLSGAGGSGRRRRAIAAAATPVSNASAGAPHSIRVVALNGGRRRTKLP